MVPARGSAGPQRCPVCLGLWLPGPVVAVVVGHIPRPGSDGGAGTSKRSVCPADGGSLAAVYHHGIEVDLCFDCGGVWLDRGELERIIARRRRREGLQTATDVLGNPDVTRLALEAGPDLIGAVVEFIVEALSGL